MRMIRKYTIALTALLAWGCTDHRDLYEVAHPMLAVEGDWMPSLDKQNMTQDATVMVYLDGERVAAKEYFYSPNSVTVKLTSGTYDVLLFNGLMYSEQDTHLDGIYFCGTDRVSSFEGCAREAAANKRLTKADGEIVASNDMEILTSALVHGKFDGQNNYFIKYRNGKNGFPSYEDYVESSVSLTPAAVSYNARVTVNLTNPSNAAVANGALRGFAGSVMMASRMPSHQGVTHHLRLNNLWIDPADDTKGRIESPVFVTFGPPLDLPGRKYGFEISVILKDGSTYNETIDVTEQVEPLIAKMRQNLGQAVPVHPRIAIELSVDVTLPDVEDRSGSIGVGEWGDDEIIRVPIK